MSDTENPEGREIDLVALFVRLWRKRRFIIYVTLCFIAFGLFIALCTSEEYTASTTFVPQTSESLLNSSMTSLASLAGISLSQIGQSESLPTTVYPQLLSNVDYVKELMYTPVKFDGRPDSVTLYDFFTDPEDGYTTFFGTLGRYTLGLPGVIVDAVRGEREVDSILLGQSSLAVYTKREYDCLEILSKRVSIDINDKDGYVTLSARMPEAYAAAQVAQTAFDLLEKYVTEYRLEKTKATLDFVDARYVEAKAEFEARQLEYARFRDANRNLSTATAQIMDDRLSQEYELANTIYTELARQKTQMEIQVKENTPVLSVVEPVVIPFERTRPKRAIIMIVFAFLGGCTGCALVFGFDYLKHNGSGWPRRWRTDEEDNDNNIEKSA
ncbi:MAG TPA: lipopolysaccharide biosynthesis protein [Candidatus Coprenecus pullistercoris]|nr:lipopolysaccharide biosynthesis protein [Candidatus Coprenecus pullistercoris]